MVAADQDEATDEAASSTADVLTLVPTCSV
jgi:hypothetical protein